VARTGIDVNLVVGRRDVSEGVERTLATRDVRAAWVTAAEARLGEPELHDEWLIGICGDASSLVPVPVLLPPTGLPGAYDRARRIAAAGHRLVRLCPTTHRYVLVDWVLSPLPELCAREGLAILLDFDPEPVSWRDVVALGRAFPSLPLVVLGVEVGADRSIPSVLDAAPNVVCAVAELATPEDLARLCKHFGASRFVCESGDRTDGKDVIAAIAASNLLAADARDAVLHANAEALARGAYAEAFLS
jgi:hypothetical protein